MLSFVVAIFNQNEKTKFLKTNRLKEFCFFPRNYPITGAIGIVLPEQPLFSSARQCWQLLIDKQAEEFIGQVNFRILPPPPKKKKIGSVSHSWKNFCHTLSKKFYWLIMNIHGIIQRDLSFSPFTTLDVIEMQVSHLL